MMLIPSLLRYASSCVSPTTTVVDDYFHHDIFFSCRRRRRIRHQHHKNKNNLHGPLSFAIDKVHELDDDDGDGILGGSYIDLGTITSSSSSNSDEATAAADSSVLENTYLHPLNHQLISPPSSSSSSSSSTEEWRATKDHWIVLIDDEPSIRLAIGDYLYSMGYKVITACDGPQSFLDVLLYSCGWSSLLMDENNDTGGSSSEDGVSGSNRPPWMNTTNGNGGGGDESMMLWRLPNCIISDIRMPGGIDGVQLLELLRRRGSSSNTNTKDDSNSSSDDDDDDDNDNDNVAKEKKKRRRPKKEDKERSINEYDGKDDFDLLDAIIVGSDGSTTRKQQQQQQGGGKIVTAIDQATQKLDVIRDTLTYHQEEETRRNNNSNSLQQQQYPTSLLQIPVILLTAKAMVSDRIVGFKAGANNYLPKPASEEELLGMVDSLLRKQERERKEEWVVSDLVVGRSRSGDDDDDDDVVVAKKSNSEEVTYVDDNELESYSAYAQQIKDLTTELIEIKNLLQGEAQRRNKVKKLTKLLPEALSMYINGERRKRLFTTDHIRSILIFCFDDASFLAARKSIVKRDDLLAELERMNDQHPDLLQEFLLDD